MLDVLLIAFPVVLLESPQGNHVCCYVLLLDSNATLSVSGKSKVLVSSVIITTLLFILFSLIVYNIDCLMNRVPHVNLFDNIIIMTCLDTVDFYGYQYLVVIVVTK